MKQKEYLLSLVEQGGNCVNLGRSIKARHIDLHQWILESTEFLNVKQHISFSERVYCILNNIGELVIDNSGEVARFVNLFSGYVMKNKVTKKPILPKEPFRKKTLVEKFITRNRKKHALLYGPNMLQGVDYVVCPISNERMPMISTNYIIKTLGMSLDDYPDVPRMSERHINKIKSGLKELDADLNITKYELGQIKARQKLLTCDSNGVSGYKKKGQKTRATHMQNIDEIGRNGYSQSASKAIINGNNTKIAKGTILPANSRTEYYRYKTVVLYVTNKHRPSITSGFVTGVAGTTGAYQIDHVYSIMHGYLNKISPLVIGGIHNLKMIPWKENIQKHAKSHIALSDLLAASNYTEEESLTEFKKIIAIIEYDIKNSIPATGAYVLERLK